jgi:cobalt-zinc-cadmium efflux system protein
MDSGISNTFLFPISMSSTAMISSRETLLKNFRLFILLSAVILVIEVVGSVITNSLALLSDAGHIVVDLAAFILSYISLRLATRRATERFTFGYYRAEILAAVINGVALILITFYILYEAYARFVHPELVMGNEMLVFAVVGFVANLYVVLRMRGYEHNLTVRSAYLHVISDTITSVGVVMAGILIILTGSYIFDLVISVIISAFILYGSIRLIRESAFILMEATPTGIDLAKLQADMERVEGVKEVHDLHVWCISSDVCSLSSHVLIDTNDAKSINEIISRINEMVKTKYNISHSVIQAECECCAEGDQERICKR